MKTSLILLMLIFTIGLAPNITPDNQLPKPPNGYSWEKLDAISGYILKPDGWFFNAEKNANTYAYFITKEDFTKDPNGMFVTGFSLNVFTNMGKTNAVDYAISMANELKGQGGLVFIQDHEFSNFKGKMLRVKKNGKTIHYDILGNTKTNKLYLAYFESSNSKWSKNEEFGKVIMNNLGFNPNF